MRSFMQTRFPRRGGSLLRMLFPSVVLVVIAGFVIAEVLGRNDETRNLPILQRLSLFHLLTETGERLPMIAIFIGLMVITLYATLHHGLRPLRRLSHLAEEIGPSTSHARLPVDSAPREVAPLVEAVNAALDRLDTGLKAQRDFAANAAHELRTPLATIRAQVESLLEPEERQAATREFDRLGRLVNQLLTLAEAEGETNADAAVLDLVSLARAVATDMAVPILASGRSVAFDSDLESLMVLGQADLIETAIRNLLENAMRHTPEGCEVVVSVEAGGLVVVGDDGPGVAERLAGRMFQRFSRGDPRGPGAGLGLSIVQQVMARHGGEARLAPCARGARFELDFQARCLPSAQSSAVVPGSVRAAM